MSGPGRRRHTPGTIERAVIAAARDGAGWLRTADEPMVWAARTIAEELDLLRRRTAQLQLGLDEGPSPAFLIGELAGRLLRCCEALGFSPAARARIGIVEDSSDLAGELAQLLDLDITVTS